MNLIIPFTKDIKFTSNISEITSISLEHEFTVNNDEILGNFIVSGDYKTHELSVNKEHFEHVLPFRVDISSRIDRETVDLAIQDFTYEIKDNDTLKIDIEYTINALELKEEEPKEELFERVEDTESLEDILDEISDENIDTQETRNVSEEDKKTILESINEQDESFVTYHIHIMQENDTIDTICTKYNTTSNVLNEYNDLSTVAIGDKLIIPDLNE
ncbi:MAG: LysM peptidoglycan-binding domain-containing protein [Bacilli bacterium]